MADQLRSLLIFSLLGGLAGIAAAESAAPRGLWMAPRGGPDNQARADLPAAMRSAPQEVWRHPTGGEVRYARSVRSAGQDAALILVGGVLELRRWDGQSVWQNARSGVSSVIGVANADGRGGDEVFAVTDVRTVVLFDLDTGRQLWTWQSEPSTFINGFKLQANQRGVRFYCFPSYSLNGYCFDFSQHCEQPRLVWQRHFDGKYLAGYGPAVVLSDMNADGRDDVVISGKNPHVYQAVLDANTGETLAEVSYEAEPGAPIHLGRPYGLFHARRLESGGLPGLTLLSCQVEEYAGVAKNPDGRSLIRIWGKYVEKDWPEDHLELRPQVTSLANLQGAGVPELVVGLWNGAEWSTCIIDPRVAFDALRATLTGCYFWGCHDFDDDGRDEIVVSREAHRRTARATRLEVLSGTTLQPIAELDEAAIFGSSDSPLPDDVSFMANRRNPVFIAATGGERGLLIRRFADNQDLGIFFWAPLATSSESCRFIASRETVRADASPDALILSTAAGEVQRFDPHLQPEGKPLVTNGRTCQPLLWFDGRQRQLIVDEAGGWLAAGEPDLAAGSGLTDSRRLRGSLAAAHIDAAGRSRLAVADMDDPDHPAVRIYRGPLADASPPQRIPLEFPPYLGLVPHGEDFRLLVNLQTGVHTMALSCFDADGRLLWQDYAQGAHPRLPAAADLNADGAPEVIADDHGVLRIYGSDGAIAATDKGWPPAYTIPITGPFGPAGEPRILRASGIQGISLIDSAAQAVWQQPQPTWRQYRSLAAVGRATASGPWCVGALAEDGVFECRDVATGEVRWSLDLAAAPNGIAIAAGNLDGAGGDEFLLGLQDGRLVCLHDAGGQGGILWEKTFDAAVANPIIADVNGDGAAEIVLSTADGYVRILAAGD